MKVSREQAAANRERIVAVAARLFRERGFEGVGVADLMKEAGLTHGGFYGHFGSKDALAAEACEHALDHSNETWRGLLKSAAPLAAIQDQYLSCKHRDGTGQGCLIAALAADIARHQNPTLRRVLTERLRPMIHALMQLMQLVPGASRQARRRKALAQLSGMIGAVVLARAVDDPKLSEEILAATRAALAEG
jgi:TetR/AcrR family transcriptional regulator, transcriptional repressor for nem operon